MKFFIKLRKIGRVVTFLGFPLIALAQGGDYAAKESIIEGIDQFERGETGADSLFAQGESHSTLAAVASYNRGRALMESGDKGQEARQAFQKSIKGNDDAQMQSDAWHNIGNTLLMEQDFEEAIEAYKSALRVNPQNEAARYNLSHALRMLNEQQEQNEQEQNEQEQNEQDQNEQEQNENEQNENEGEQEQEQEQQGEDEQSEGDQGDDEQEQQGEDGQNEGEEGQQEQEQEQPAAPEQIEGQISKEDMERILESLERGEEEVQAKLMRAKSQGKKKKIEKDW